ncbi:DDE superfamily endonuclease [Actinopolyspora xinjiangensis]|uniref:DDE superfamily endonuclease n=1 Tax=Actinopolyspora xinjiangensis TaxID=405564 RepID=A0A1H0X449_9ACTN|nr:transposase family protein [Actinopolyspora xinjiangensis]SDP97505.1 DDE superfamily endonuclease [Actinopolyspora xinjiangensis]
MVFDQKPTHTRKSRCDTTGLCEDQLCRLTERISGVVHWDTRNTFSVLTAVAITLKYFRTHLTQQQLAAVPQTTRSTLSRVLSRIEPILADILEEFCLTPEEIGDDAAVIDGVFLPTGNRRDQDQLYSGTHRRYGVSFHAATDIQRNLITLSEIFPGATHDLTVFRESSYYMAPNQSNTLGDLGYLGSTVTHPRTSPKGYELDSTPEKIQHGPIPSPRSRRTRHRSPEKLENHRHTLPPTTHSPATSAPHHHRNPTPPNESPAHQLSA